MSGPNDITTANSVIAEKTPGGDKNQRRARSRASRDTPSTTARALAHTATGTGHPATTRARRVILTPGSRIEKPSSSVTINANAATKRSNRGDRSNRRENIDSAFFAVSAGGFFYPQP